MDARRRWQRVAFGGAIGFTVLAMALLAWLGAGPQPVAALAMHTEFAAVVDGDALSERAGAMPAPSLEPSLRLDAAFADALGDLAVVDTARLRQWVEDLRADDIRWNAESAKSRLVHAPAAQLVALEEALASADLQQRVLAAVASSWRCTKHGLDPGPRLLEVCVEGLSNEVGRRLRDLRSQPVTSEFTRFLAPHAVAARGPLRRALAASGDEQQRFLSAWLLAQAGNEPDVARIARELVPHLADNDIAGDAVMATHGLYRLGTTVVPTLHWWRPHVDEQARRMIDLIVADLERPPRDMNELARRGRGQRVTRVYHDPAVQYDVRRSRVPTWRSR